MFNEYVEQVNKQKNEWMNECTNSTSPAATFPACHEDLYPTIHKFLRPQEEYQITSKALISKWKQQLKLM